MENSFFHERLGGLFSQRSLPGAHVPSRKSANSTPCRDGLAASGEEGKALPLFILRSLSSCLWRSCPFQFFVRRPFFFQRKKRFHGRSVFAVQPGFCGVSSSICPHGLGSRRELRRAPKSPAALGSALLQRNGEGFTNFSDWPIR